MSTVCRAWNWRFPSQSPCSLPIRLGTDSSVSPLHLALAQQGTPFSARLVFGHDPHHMRQDSHVVSLGQQLLKSIDPVLYCDVLQARAAKNHNLFVASGPYLIACSRQLFEKLL